MASHHIAFSSWLLTLPCHSLFLEFSSDSFLKVHLKGHPLWGTSLQQRRVPHSSGSGHSQPVHFVKHLSQCTAEGSLPCWMWAPEEALNLFIQLGFWSQQGLAHSRSDMVFRGPWHRAGWPLVCSALTEGPVLCQSKHSSACPSGWQQPGLFPALPLSCCSPTLAPASWWCSRVRDPRGGMRSCAARAQRSSEKGASINTAVINPVGTHSAF